MAQDKPFRWRTIIEVAVVSLILWVFLGSPGLKHNTDSPSGNLTQEDREYLQRKLEQLVLPEKTLKCPSHDYNIHVLSTKPLIMLVDGFLSEGEADHLVEISEGKWSTTTISHGGKAETDERVRKSEHAKIERDTTVQCIEQRALALQGWPKDTYLERLHTQRYNVTGHYAHHFDWATASKTARRESTFMVYVEDQCEGGGTNFPKLECPSDERWREFLDCESGENGVEGVTFKAKKGAAVFWTNFDSEGRGYKETIHAGMPVTSGTKVGLNIWSWYQKSFDLAD